MAVRDWIKIDDKAAGANEAAELKQLVRDMRSVYERLGRVKAKMDHNFDDSNPANILWGDLETLWGLPAGKGDEVYNFVNGSLGSTQGTFQVADFKNMTDRVG
jgi:hypothetical protein